MNLTKSTTYRGEHRGFQFCVETWERDDWTSEGSKVTCWTYYVFLHETKVKNFDELWLPQQKHEYASRSWYSYDYYNSWVSREIKWHGGVTYYAKHNEAPNRCVEFGCDFQPIFAEGQSYTLEQVVTECETTINMIANYIEGVNAN